MLLTQIVAGVLVALAASGFWVEYLLLLRSTRRRQLRPNALIRATRGIRAFWLTVALAVPAWPHLLELALGLHRTPTAMTRRWVVWTHGPVQLSRYQGTPGGVPVLLVHSLVTRPSVLDLTPGLSLVESLLQQGHDVWLLDWGTVSAREANWGLDAYGGALWQAEQVVASHTGQRVHVVGYCAGGTLAVAVHAAQGHGVAQSLSLLAAPLDTESAGGFFQLLRRPFVLPGAVLDGNGLVPPAVIREAFHALRPQAVKTMRKVLRLRADAFRRTAAGALGRWAWEQTPVSGALLFDVVDLARSNSLVRGGLVMGGVGSDLRRLAGLPILVVTTVRDHIVPPASSTALGSVPGLEVEQVQCTAGHVAMLVGPEGQAVLYPALNDWIRRNSR